MRALAIAILLVDLLAAGAGAAHADDTFEAKAQGAQRVKRIENVVWALTATCDKGDDTENRQCRRVRDSRAAELANATLLVDGDADAFDMTAFDAKKKSIGLTLAPCIRCAGVEVEGKSYVVNGGTAKLYDNAKAFSDESAAKAWTKSIGNARVQMLVKVPAKAVDGKTVKLDIVGYRVWAPCDGSIIVANPPSGPGEADKKACRAVAAEPAQGPAVKELTAAVVAEAMKPAVDAAQKCFEKFGVAGKAKLKLTVASDGTIARYEQQGDFANTATGACIDKALEKARFPANGKPKTTISFPITLQ
jgi:hypothetical protein